MLYAHKKHLRGKKSLIRLFVFLYFSLSVLVLFVLLLGCLFVLCPWNLFVKKIRFKTAPMIIYITTLEPNDVRKTNNGKKPKNIEKSVVALLFWRYKCWAVTYGWGDGGGGYFSTWNMCRCYSLWKQFQFIDAWELKDLDFGEILQKLLQNCYSLRIQFRSLLRSYLIYIYMYLKPTLTSWKGTKEYRSVLTSSLLSKFGLKIN